MNFYTEQFNYYEHFATIPNQLPEEEKYADKDEALLPGKIIVNPTEPQYADDRQHFRTTSGMARTPKGRLFLSYFSSGEHADEGAGNYNMIICSDDGGKSFYNKVLILPSTTKTRVYDCNPWVDDLGRFWIFYSQSFLSTDGREGIWVTRCDNPDDDAMVFTEPYRIGNGILTTQPIVTKNGDWLFPVAIWDPKWCHGGKKGNMVANWLPDEIGVSIYRSKDKGFSFERIASNIRFPYSTFDEPCIVERTDGSLMMWIRGMNCVGHTFSYDGGYTWSIPVQHLKMNLPNTRFHFGKLKSGNILLLANYKADMFSYYGGRNHLTALISKDDGVTWDGFLMIDEREGSQQPDFVEGNDGFIYITYGRAPQFAAESMLAIVTEEDILAGKLIHPNSKLRIVAGKSTGMMNNSVSREWVLETARQNNIEI